MRLTRLSPSSRFWACSLLVLSLALPPLVISGQASAAVGDGDSEAARPSKSKKKHASNDVPAEIQADQIQQDRDLNTVTARGHVEVTQSGRTLLADTLSYNLKQDVIVASGNVSLTDVDGQVTFADYMEITGDMKEAAVSGIRVLMTDDSHLSGVTGRRIGGTRTILNNAQYTACKPCAEHPKDPPLWQLHASTVTHDEIQHVIEYEDVWMDFEGIPIAYSPYFSHTDPLVKRKSGLLAPSMLNNSSLGSAVRVPYFQV